MAQDFYDEYNHEYDEYNDEYPVERVTDEDVWYAMTDGMYGDYPGHEWNPEWFGF